MQMPSWPPAGYFHVSDPGYLELSILRPQPDSSHQHLLGLSPHRWVMSSCSSWPGAEHSACLLAHTLPEGTATWRPCFLHPGGVYPRFPWRPLFFTIWSRVAFTSHTASSILCKTERKAGALGHLRGFKPSLFGGFGNSLTSLRVDVPI